MQDSLNILRSYEYDNDYIEHYDVLGMKWGHRKQKPLSKLQRREDRAKKNLTDRSYSSLTNLKSNLLKQNKKYENKQYKNAKPYADSEGRFKITDPKKVHKHYMLSEKIISNKRVIKEIDKVIKDGVKDIHKKYYHMPISTINNWAAQNAHQTAVRNHMSFMNQVAQQNTLQSIQNFHQHMDFSNMINLQNIQTHNMMF